MVTHDVDIGRIEFLGAATPAAYARCVTAVDGVGGSTTRP